MVRLADRPAESANRLATQAMATISRIRPLLLSFCAALLALGGVPTGIVAASQPEPPDLVTFNRDIAPLLFERCGSCHHPGGVAPFSLLTYSAAKSRANLIATVTKSRLMPPWKSEPGYGDFIGQRHAQRRRDRSPPAMGRDWSARRGSARPATGASMDRRLAARYARPGRCRCRNRTPCAGGGFGLFPRPSSCRCRLTAPATSAGSSFARAIRPSCTTRTSGSIARPRRGGSTTRIRSPGYDGLLLPSAVYPDGHFLGWTPGQVAPLLPEGLAWRLEPGHRSGRRDPHRSRTASPNRSGPTLVCIFSDDPPERTPAMLRLGRQSIDIRAGRAALHQHRLFVLPVDVGGSGGAAARALSRARGHRAPPRCPDGTTVAAHLHQGLGLSLAARLSLRHAAGAARRARPCRLRYVFDNSADNPRNPHQPPRRVLWGQRSTDEMGDLWIQMLPRSDRDLQGLNEALRVEACRRRDCRLRNDDSRRPTRECRCTTTWRCCTPRSGGPDEAVSAFRNGAEGCSQSRPAAHYNLGTALTSPGNVTEAIEQYREALGCSPTTRLAHNNLGHALLALGKAGRGAGIIFVRRCASIPAAPVPTTTSARSRAREATCQRRSIICARRFDCNRTGFKRWARWHGYSPPLPPPRPGRPPRRSIWRRMPPFSPITRTRLYWISWQLLKPLPAGSIWRWLQVRPRWRFSRTRLSPPPFGGASPSTKPGNRIASRAERRSPDALWCRSLLHEPTATAPSKISR